MNNLFKTVYCFRCTSMSVWLQSHDIIKFAEFVSSSGQEMAMVEASQTQSVVTLKDVLDAEAGDIPTLTAIGYAVTSSQPWPQRSTETFDGDPLGPYGSDAGFG